MELPAKLYCHKKASETIELVRLRRPTGQRGFITFLLAGVCWIPGAGRTSAGGGWRQTPSLPLAAFILEMELSLEGTEEDTTLMKNTCLIP
ncbi:hypothetical protein JOQ06_024948 [Pogonophryne albipinna]|uniref:Uncharacterized protein n=1 Tax=Pogonophryne albipinna TaxID=1090488 RepID=A0AAD6ATC6_9TELE|nr:hypothetical protein JOQ06_024948 [Pogonophryne albipinna]